MDTLGSRIRLLRKNKKMTLEQVADGKLTKGMLSLIENGKAHPSMDSLQHIAKQLSVDVSELIGGQNREEIRAILNKAEILWEKVESPKETQPLLELIEPVLDQLPDTYEGARLLELYSKSQLILDDNQDQNLLLRAKSIYEKIHLYNEVVGILIFQSKLFFMKKDFEKALSFVKETRKSIELSEWHLNTMTKIELDYVEAAYYYAAGDYESGAKITEKALAHTKETKIFHYADQLYKLLIIEAMMNDRKDRWRYYLKKLKEYAHFTEDPFTEIIAEYFNVLYVVQYERDYEKAFSMITELTNETLHLRESNKLSSFTEEMVTETLLIEKGILLFFLDKYREALSLLDHIKLDDYMAHPFDLSLQYRKYVYTALCHLQLGNHEMAQKEINIAIELYGKIPPTPYTQLAQNAYDKIMQMKGPIH